MKWLGYVAAAIAGVVVVAVLVLLVLGARSDHRIAGTVDIAQPPDVVFQWITEPQRLMAWVGWLVDVQMVTPAQEQVGARQVWVMEDRNNGNQRMNIEAEIVTYEPSQRLTARLSAADAFTGSVDYGLARLDATRTRLTYSMSYEYEQWFVKLLEPLIARAAQQKLDEDLARLKQRAEAEPPGYAQGK
jgi:uncharacterized protein YndB with AHSA1/START domain